MFVYAAFCPFPAQIANIYFDAGLQCGDRCYVGLPFVLKCKYPPRPAPPPVPPRALVCTLSMSSVSVAEARTYAAAMQEDIWDSDVDLHQKLLKRWRELKERSGIQ